MSRDEGTALALACRQDRLAGDGAEAACRERELHEAANVARPAALELLTLAEQLRLGSVCGPAQALGPAELRACQESGIRARAFLAELEPPSDGLEDVALSAELGDIAPAAAPEAE